MSYTLPSEVDARPVAVVGAGILGRRIAAMFAAGGTDVRIFDLSAEQRAAAVAYVTQQAPGIRQKLGLTAPRIGAVGAASDLQGRSGTGEARPENLTSPDDAVTVLEASARSRP